MKDRTVVRAVGRQLDEVRRLVRRDIRGKVDDERSGARLHDGLLRRTLRGRVRE
jgi:hypothetical protein